MKLANSKKRRTPHARTEMLSVKVSPVEKYLIVHAARKMGISPSEFVRRVAVGASRNLGIKEPEVAQAQEFSFSGESEKAAGTDFDGKAEGEPPVAT